MNIKHLLKDHAYQNIPLTFEEAYALGWYALRGCDGDALAQIQSIAALSALHNKSTYSWTKHAGLGGNNDHRLPDTAAEQIAGLCAAIFDHDIAQSQSGFLRPNVPYAMDNCGMGGDLVVTANVSTLAALIASAAGIPMCKHGSPANADKGRHGSSDFVSMLGINTYARKLVVKRCVEELGFGYTEALDLQYKKIHLQTHQVAQLPHMNDIIGPITNPLHPSIMTRRVLGVNHLVSPRVVAEAYKILNKRGITNLEHGLFVRGYVDKTQYEGMDEVSICDGGTQLVELRDGEILERHVSAEDFGVDSVSRESVSPPDGVSKGDFSLGILKGEINSSALSMVLANSALLFYLAEKSADLKECYSMARDVHLSGLDLKKAEAVREFMSK
jgi:anthranilate phosphoribosyltransferase